MNETGMLFSAGALHYAIQLLVPTMIVLLGFAVFFRYFIYKTVKRHEWFAMEFERRVNEFMETENPNGKKHTSFYMLCKKLLERSFYESFELRDRLHRRKRDKVESFWDRQFLVRPGSAWLVRDLLKQIRYVKFSSENPKMLNITKATFQQNPYFNRVFGVFNIGSFNDFINILPGLFVIGGILGTFIGIVSGLPKLGGMNLADMEVSKTVMDGFLVEVAVAMNSSILGIACSLVMTVLNTIYSADRVYSSTIDRLESSLDLLWYRSENNHFVELVSDEKDPTDVLAEETLLNELNKGKRTRSMDELHKPKAG
ncbi:MAG: hypothetical protein ACK5P5_09070 [Pseudobdellovibrionaceae bacterium]